jgi:hypothetical protein
MLMVLCSAPSKWWLYPIPNLLPLMITAGLMGYFGTAKTIHNIGFSIAFDFQSMIPSIS